MINELEKLAEEITDMTIKGATQTELAKVIEHSIIVIDAEKTKRKMNK